MEENEKYKVELNIVDDIEAKNEEESIAIFWDRFESSVWEPTVTLIN